MILIQTIICTAVTHVKIEKQRTMLIGWFGKRPTGAQHFRSSNEKTESSGIYSSSFEFHLLILLMNHPISMLYRNQIPPENKGIFLCVAASDSNELLFVNKTNQMKNS